MKLVHSCAGSAAVLKRDTKQKMRTEIEFMIVRLDWVSTKCLGQSSLSALMFSSLSAGTAAQRSATMKCVWQIRAEARDYDSWQLARRLHTVPREDTKLTPVRQWGGGGGGVT